MKSLIGFFLICFFVVSTSIATLAQSDRGKIIKKASPVLDPNGDGFVSKTTNGFSFDGYYVDEFETTMFGIPKLTGDVAGDNIGKACGITDLTPDKNGFSVYAVRDNNNNLIFRFRVGDDNPSVEAWTILLDTDGLFGANDPNATANNPGFEIDITLIKNKNKGVLVYNIDGIESCPTPILSYPFSSHFQISIADEVTCGNPDYFYDFFVPFGEIAAAFGINVNTGLRYAAVSNVSATCAMSGQIADISGVNYNDYKSCVGCAFTDLVENQCPTPIIDLCETCPGFNNAFVAAPTINLPVKAGQTQISGTAGSGIYIIVEVYSRTGGTDASPIWSTTAREIKTTYAIGTLWSVTLNAPLQSFDKIVAKAQLDANSVPCGANGSNSASASVTVVQPNDRPLAISQSVSTPEDVQKLITLTGTDPDNDPLTYFIVANPTHGVLTGTAPNITYTPNLNYNGSDSFTFNVSDGIYTATVVGTVTINVTPVNDAPTAISQNITVVEDIPKSITLSGNDIDGDALTYIVQTQPTHGVLSGTAPNLIYTPTLNYNGTDNFTFFVNDGNLNSSVVTIFITITPVNDAPIANNQSVIVIEDTPKVITLTGTDVDGNTLTYSIVASPSHGTLTGTGSTRTYTPSLNYNGPDNFTFKVNDGNVDSNIATVTISVTAVNDAPIANDQSVTVTEDIAKSITLTGRDVDGDVLSFSVQTAPAHGVLTGTAPNLLYTPASNYYGSDSFTFFSNDGTINSNLATVFITVTPVSDPPVANNLNIATAEDTPVPFTLTGSDPDGDAITFLLVSNPSNGTLSGTAPNLTYTPALNFNGVDNFTFKVNDGTSDSNIGTVTITVSAVNDDPIANNQNATYTLNTPKALILTGSDPDGDGITFSIITTPTNGVLSGTAPNITYTPNTGFTGNDSFTFQVNDGSRNSNIATVSLSLATAFNNSPTASNQNVSVIEDTPKLIILSASDIDGDPIVYTIVSAPTHGTLTGTDANRTYSPTLNYNGSDSFTFKVNDGTVDSNIATVFISISEVNDPPVANAQSVTTPEDTPTSITLTGFDAEGNTLTYTLVSQPLHGSISGSAPNLTYSPALNYNGSDSFTFSVNDGTFDSNIATVSINITSVNDAPIAINNDTSTTDEDTPITFNIILNDIDVDGNINPASVDLNPATPIEDKTFDVPGEGTYQVNAAGDITFTPFLNYNGTTTPIPYTVKDNLGELSNVAFISVVVIPVNDAPEPASTTVTIDEDLSAQICITVTDVENDPSVLKEITTLNGNGTVVLDPQSGPFCFIYTPNPNFNGQDKVSVTVCDANDPALCNTGTITINVLPVNDPPGIRINGLEVDSLNYLTVEEVPLDFCFEVEDIDGDITSISPFTSTSATGTLTQQATGIDNKFCFQYIPAVNFNGESIWKLSICDSNGLCKEITITITVTPVNDAPTADNLSITILEDAVTNITLPANDVDGDVLTFTITSNPANGALSGTGANRTYTPNTDYSGSDSFTFQVNDGELNSNVGTVSITITPENDPPVLTNLSVEAREDSVLQVCLSVTDAEGDNVTFEEVTNLSGGGTMTPDPTLNFCFVFTPPLNYNGYSVWQVKVCDNFGMCSTGEVRILVIPVNDPPVAQNDLIEVFGGTTNPVDVLQNDLTIESPFQEFYDIYASRDSTDNLTVTRVKTYNGTATIENNVIQYTPNFDFMGQDSMRYWIQDSGGLYDSAVVYIEVGPAKFHIYQAVSPNGDGLNDHWQISGIEQDQNNLVRVFDRFNNLVFETRGYTNEGNNWHGQANHGLVKGTLPEGTYYYSISIDLTEDNQGIRIFKGYVVLKSK